MDLVSYPAQAEGLVNINKMNFYDNPNNQK